jgi:3-methyladenine DNA glycosylase AlkD
VEKDQPLLKLAEIKAALHAHADKASAADASRFFKLGPGEYGEGDAFIGVSLPDLRGVMKRCAWPAPAVIDALLRSPIHEERSLALLLMVRAFERGDETLRRSIYRRYLAAIPASINNWDLVDCSAAQIVGGWLEAKSRAPLHKLARGRSIWQRRVAIVATYHFIRRGESADTFALAELLLNDDHDLIHKATGWMLREVGKRASEPALIAFLNEHAGTMPRTMLRYAIERFPEAHRRRWMEMRSLRAQRDPA